MIIYNTIPSQIFSPIGLLKNRIEQLSTIQITIQEAQLFAEAVQMVETQLHKEEITPNTRATVIFSNGKTLTIGMKSTGICTEHIIVIDIAECRENHYSQLIMHTVFVEELCHCFWNEFDEIKIKHKVIDVLRNKYPNISYNDLFEHYFEKMEKSQQEQK